MEMTQLLVSADGCRIFTYVQKLYVAIHQVQFCFFLDKSLCDRVVECSLDILLVKPHHFFRARVFSPLLLEFIWCFALVRSFRRILCVLVYCSFYDGEKQRGEEYMQTCRGPTFGDFVTIFTEGPMKDNTGARLQSTRVQTPLSPSIKCNANVLRENLSEDSQNIPCETLQRKGSRVVFIYLREKQIYIPKIKLGSGLFLLNPDYLAITKIRIQMQQPCSTYVFPTWVLGHPVFQVHIGYSIYIGSTYYR